MIEANLLVGYAQVGDKRMRVAIPVLLHDEAGTIWQYDTAFPIHTETDFETAGRVFADIRRVAVLEWPEFAGACDWAAWKFREKEIGYG